MFKNVATKVALFAFDTTTGAGKTGDAANITAYVSKDFGTVTVLADTSATEMDATNARGWYLFDVAQGETNADSLLFTGKSTTSNIAIVGRPIETTPNRFTSMVIDAAGLVDATTVKVGPTGAATAQTAGDIMADTNDIQTRLPAALVGGRMDASVGAMAADVITATAIATDAIGALELAAGAASEIATAVRTELTTELGRIDVAVSTRASQTSVDTVAGYVDTEVAAIKAKTDNLPTDPADASDIAASFSTVNATLATIAGYIDTEVAAIKAKTDNLPTDPADASDIAASFATVNTKLDTIDDFVDTEVAAIKVVTDKLGVMVQPTSDAYQFTADALELAPSGGSGSAPSAATIADAVWDEAQSGHATPGTFGAALTDADTRGDRVVVRGTVGGGASTTSITTSAFDPGGAAADQFKGRIVVFDNATATAALRGQATDITASSNSATPTLTVTALTSAPASGDTFSVL